MKKSTEISERISQVIDYLSLSKNDFAKKLGYNRSQNIYDIVNGKSKPSFDFFFRFFNSEYSELFNVDWIFLGKGKMLNTLHQDAFNEIGQNYLGTKDILPKETFTLKTDRSLKIQNIPLYDIEASAGLVGLFSDSSEVKPIDTISIPNLPPCDGAVFVTGDSMYPLLKSGDIIAYKQIEDFVNDIYWGQMYLISTEMAGDEFRAVKYIQKSEKGDQYIKLVSQNQHHQPKDIHLSKVRAMALIKASIRMH